MIGDRHDELELAFSYPTGCTTSISLPFALVFLPGRVVHVRARWCLRRKPHCSYRVINFVAIALTHMIDEAVRERNGLLHYVGRPQVFGLVLPSCPRGYHSGRRVYEAKAK